MRLRRGDAPRTRASLAAAHAGRPLLLPTIVRAAYSVMRWGELRIHMRASTDAGLVLARRSSSCIAPTHTVCAPARVSLLAAGWAANVPNLSDRSSSYEAERRARCSPPGARCLDCAPPRSANRRHERPSKTLRRHCSRLRRSESCRSAEEPPHRMISTRGTGRRR
jgi:hypothetical protein